MMEPWIAEQAACLTAVDAQGVAAWGKGPHRRSALDYQRSVWSRSLICTCWGHNTVRALFLRTLCALFIYLLSNLKCVNQKPQRGEGRGEMDIDVKRQRIYFCLWVFVCFVGFLIKTRKPCVVYDVEGCVGEAVCLCDCVAGKGGGGGPLPCRIVD